MLEPFQLAATSMLAIDQDSTLACHKEDLWSMMLRMLLGLSASVPILWLSALMQRVQPAEQTQTWHFSWLPCPAHIAQAPAVQVLDAHPKTHIIHVSHALGFLLTSRGCELA